MDSPGSYIYISTIQSVRAEPLPVYTEEELQQTAFEALTTRIAASTPDPNDRVILDSFVKSQRSPAYNGPKKAEAPKPIKHCPDGARRHLDALTRVKQHIVMELFNAIGREDHEAIALLINHNLVTANTTSQAGQRPLLEAINTKNVFIVKELLDFGADVNAFGVIVSTILTSYLSITNHNIVATELLVQ